jgi:hypothetical protein
MADEQGAIPGNVAQNFLNAAEERRKAAQEHTDTRQPGGNTTTLGGASDLSGMGEPAPESAIPTTGDDNASMFNATSRAADVIGQGASAVGQGARAVGQAVGQAISDYPSGFPDLSTGQAIGKVAGPVGQAISDYPFTKDQSIGQVLKMPWDKFTQLLTQHGQFDTLVNHGAEHVLSGLAQPAAQPQAQPQAQQPVTQSQPKKYANPAEREMSTPNKVAFGYRTAGTFKAPAEGTTYKVPKDLEAQGVTDELYTAAQRRFPHDSVDDQQKASDWMMEQVKEGKDRTSKEKIAEGKEEGKKAHEDRVDARQRLGLEEHMKRTQAFITRNAKSNPKQTAIVQAALRNHPADIPGFKKEVEEAGLNYERDVLQTPQVSTAQPGNAPQKQGANTQGAQQSGKRPLPKVGEVVDGRKFLGGNPNDEAAWE